MPGPGSGTAAEATSLFQDAEKFSTHLRALRMERLTRKTEVRVQGVKRRSLTPVQRRVVLAKTGGRCHICGGPICGKWAADHVFPRAQGGEHAVGNYLPAHAICNGSRWFYGTEEFQWILKLGVWLRTQIEEKNDGLALILAQRFIEHEVRRNARQKSSRQNVSRHAHAPGKQAT